MKVKTINHIETSSICSNACRYCPAGHIKEHRSTGLMTMETFMKVVEWVDVLVAKGTQREVNLHGIGEPTLNPNIVEFSRIMRDHLPPQFGVHLNTNGNHMTDELADGLRKAGVTVDVTAHDAYTAARCIRILNRYGVFGGVSLDFVLNPHDWAGQVDWFEANYCLKCAWLGYGQSMVLWDGTVVTCCIDAFATKPLGNIHNGVVECEKIELGPFDLCKKCHHEIVNKEEFSR